MGGFCHKFLQELTVFLGLGKAAACFISGEWVVHWLCYWHVMWEEGHLGIGNLSWENASFRFAGRQICRTFPWLMIDYGKTYFLCEVPPHGRWSSVVQESRLNNLASSVPLWFLLRFLTPCSCLGFLPLTFLNFWLWLEHVSQINPFLIIAGSVHSCFRSWCVFQQ